MKGVVIEDSGYCRKWVIIAEKGVVKKSKKRKGC